MTAVVAETTSFAAPDVQKLDTAGSWLSTVKLLELYAPSAPRFAPQPDSRTDVAFVSVPEVTV